MSVFHDEPPNLHESDETYDSWGGHTADYLINDILKCPPPTPSKKGFFSARMAGMKTDISITVFSDEEKNPKIIESILKKELHRIGVEPEKHVIQKTLAKRSIDARHGKIKIHLKYSVSVDEEKSEIRTSALPEWKNTAGIPSEKLRTVVIVGSGPAGLFAALKLLEQGIRPVIIEQGEETFERRKSIAEIGTKGILNENSNYCFGEGGAGTFSDGKLYTRCNKRGSVPKILEIFFHFGSDKKILTDSHPHIGTEKLPLVVNNIKNFIKSMGGVFYFGSKFTDLVFADEKGSRKVVGVKFTDVKSLKISKVDADSVILATGHSAYDTYYMMAKLEPKSLEQKTFAMGVRIEHPRSLIDSIQYHGKNSLMEAAEYRLTSQVDMRGVYSFCMCPGGFIVPSQSSEDEIVLNGMSASGRNSRWSNSAIVTEIRGEDIPDEFKNQAEKENCPSLSGLYFRKWLERQTKKHGDGFKAPSQLLKDFLDKKDSASLIDTSFSPGVVPSRLDEWLPPFMTERLSKGFLEFEKKMHGFLSEKAILLASETRTSTPVRILRDKESLESPAAQNLYPCGEGSGYAGGIVSSAMDGEKVAAKIAEKLL